jgi:tRNA(fMet)-specific endonuclease VapC
MTRTAIHRRSRHSAIPLVGHIAGDLDRVGRPIGRCDPMIAAVALTRGLELVTGNTVHYQRIQQLGYPLTLANWRIPWSGGETPA